MKVLLLISVITATMFVANTNGANIMFFFGMSPYSHRISVWPLVEELANSGHNVTFISAYTPKKPHPKVNDYVPQSIAKGDEIMATTATHIFYEQRRTQTVSEQWWEFSDYTVYMCSVLMGDEEFFTFLTLEKWDLIVVDSLGNECAYAWVHYHKSKLILFNTANPLAQYVDSIGFPDESSWLPNMEYFPQWTETGGMTFWDRVTALIVPLRHLYIRENDMFPRLEEIIRDEFDPTVPSFSDIERNASLVLMNHHPAEDFPRPLPPNVIPLGGLHIYEKNDNDSSTGKLPKELEKFIGNDEFIYMSFGCAGEVSQLPSEIRDVFYSSLKKIKIKVVWKTRRRPEGLPSHVYTGKWMPQQDLLSHPKIRAFITHSGLLAIHEAIYNAVPLVSIPIFAEQDYNANKVEARKIGVKLEIVDITEEIFLGGIENVLNNKEYAENMKRVSIKFRDRPMSALDTAMYWVNYVLRHEDTSHLRPYSVHLPWWKKRQLDILAVVFALLSITVLLAFKILRFTASIILRKCGSSSHENSMKKKQ